MRFKVYDRKHTQTDVQANVTVTVREIPHEAVINSGSVRIAGLSDEDFIRVWNYRVSYCIAKLKFVVFYLFINDDIILYNAVYDRHRVCKEVKLTVSETSWRIYLTLKEKMLMYLVSN